MNNTMILKGTFKTYREAMVAMVATTEMNHPTRILRLDSGEFAVVVDTSVTWG